jgi:hypothetical protein
MSWNSHVLDYSTSAINDVSLLHVICSWCVTLCMSFLFFMYIYINLYIYWCVECRTSPYGDVEDITRRHVGTCPLYHIRKFRCGNRKFFFGRGFKLNVVIRWRGTNSVTVAASRNPWFFVVKPPYFLMDTW